jgi:hypothetical protein
MFSQKVSQLTTNLMAYRREVCLDAVCYKKTNGR